ncbi:hypothetical protein BJV78DRAFT_167782 [Lactifluus subvellereus]|nr:hypothetical protein BJV78DRAFT_167782 [Lactifluus subvellereus]
MQPMEVDHRTTTVITLPTLAQTHFDELKANVRGELYRRGDQHFSEHTRLFNGNVLNTSKAVALPLDAQDVSQIIIFCNKHGFSPSVKAGGYGTGGWAINGDIVIDLSRIQDIDIEPPQPGGGYTSLRDTAPSISKGKARVGEAVPDPSGPATQKRVLEGDAAQGAGIDYLPTAWLYSTASAAVASFLHGPPLPPDESGEEPRRPAVNRQLLGTDGTALSISTHPSVTEPLTSHSDALLSGGGSGSGTGTNVVSSAISPASAAGWSTLTMTPASSQSPLSASAVSSVPAPFAWADFETAPVRPDPFAYIDNADPPMLGVSPPTPLRSRATTWGADAALLTHPLFAEDVPPHLTRPVPPHTHAYVSFGAGARQKDVDLFTAAHPLDGGNVPYHVPLCVCPFWNPSLLFCGVSSFFPFFFASAVG